MRELEKKYMRRSCNEMLKEIKDYIQECRESGETDLRSIIQFVDSMIIECDNEKSEEPNP